MTVTTPTGASSATETASAIARPQLTYLGVLGDARLARLACTAPVGTPAATPEPNGESRIPRIARPTGRAARMPVLSWMQG